MRFLLSLVIVIATVSRCCVQAATPRGVFAHFMVGNAKDFTFADWQENIIRASHAHINGFALNMAADWEHNDDSLKLAFPAAMSLGFKMIFSFDYAGGGPWDKATVTRMIQDWGNHPAYWQHDGKPLVSTFEGPGNAADWHDIKAATNCFFMPDWSSEGAGPALQLAGGVADGLFSWAAWPWANRDVDTYTDHSYTQALNGKPYMMAVSPWFFTNLPGYNKNWLWWGGNLWYERWQQTLDIKPDYVQIISWNDFGESHHIGPLDPRQYEAFEVGGAPYNYVQDHSHEGWLQHLPFMIDTYLGKNPTFDTESAVIVHQVTWAEKCHAGGTTGNTASQLQAEYPPEDISHDNLYIAALLTSSSDLYVEHGEGGPVTVVKADKWDISPDGGVGLYYTTVPMKAPGKQTVNLKKVVVGSKSETVTRDESLSTFVDGACNSLVAANWNAKMAWKSWIPWEKKEYRHKVDLKDRVCTKGWGWGDFHSICQYTCSYGYCPDSCVCTNMGAQREKPEPAYEVGFPKNGDANFQGLCNVAVNLGGLKAFSDVCSGTEQPKYIPSVSPFLPNACTAGTGPGNNQGLCQYGCDFGFCPINMCTCTRYGALSKPPAITEDINWKLFKDLNDSGLCHFACSRGWCPDHCAAKLEVEPPSIICPRDSTDCGTVKEATLEFPRVDWDATATTCEGETLRKLVKTHRGAVEMMRYTGTTLDVAYLSPGFNRYFVRSTAWKEEGPEDLPWKFDSMSQKYKAVYDWAAGPLPSGGTHRQKITYVCKEPSWLKAADKCSWGNPAKTINPNIKGYPNYMVVYLCPYYFSDEVNDLEDIIEEYYALEEMPYGKGVDTKNVTSREQILLHEWFHNAYNDPQPATIFHITDMQVKLSSPDMSSPTGEDMYGPGITHRWAWAKVNPEQYNMDTKDVVWITMTNADNWAWMLGFNWYANKWHWSTDGTPIPGSWPEGKRSAREWWG